MKNSLVKFGLITHLIEDVSQFKKSIKMLPAPAQKLGGKAGKSSEERRRTSGRTDKEVGGDWTLFV